MCGVLRLQVMVSGSGMRVRRETKRICGWAEVSALTCYRGVDDRELVSIFVHFVPSINAVVINPYELMLFQFRCWRGGISPLFLRSSEASENRVYVAPHIEADSL